MFNPNETKTCGITMNISIVVPVLNEALLIESCLRQLRKCVPEAELIIVDGGSTDGTLDRAAPFCDRGIRSRRGRGVQMNAGAEIARGEILWFLHVDVKPPPQCSMKIAQAVSDGDVVGGFFRIQLPRSRFVYRWTDTFAHYAGLILGLRYSDHGFFCRREIFFRIGGFPDEPLMEDADFFRKLRKAGRIAVIEQPLVVDPRRYELIGPVWLTFVYGVISLLYLFHAPRPLLQSIYRQACCRS